MSDTTANLIKINTPEEFRAIAKKYGVAVGERGRLPMRELSRLLAKDQLNGKIKFADTDYFPISKWALGETIGTRKSRDSFSFIITYTVKNVEGAQTLTLTENEIRSYLPNVKGMIGAAFATMAVALHLNAEESETALSVLTNYTVTDVKRVETEQPSETTADAPKGEETGETDTDADKAPETPAVVETVEVKPESKPRASRTRAAAAKTPAKAKATKKDATKELVSA